MEEIPMDDEFMEELGIDEITRDEDVDYPDRTTPIDKLLDRWPA